MPLVTLFRFSIGAHLSLLEAPLSPAKSGEFIVAADKSCDYTLHRSFPIGHPSERKAGGQSLTAFCILAVCISEKSFLSDNLLSSKLAGSLLQWTPRWNRDS